MAMSSFWTVGALGAEDIAELARRAGPAIEAAAARPSAVAAWERWERDAARGGGAVPVRGADRNHTEAAWHLFEMVNDSAFEALSSSCELHVMEWWDRFSDNVDPFIEAYRKDNPVAALFHGLGPARAAALPGWAGDAVLTSAEVRRLLPAVEAAFAMTGAERTRVLARIDDWPSLQEEPEELLDQPLRVWRDTAGAGMGLLAARIWF
ncbi:hypothetical protein [Streptomyces sp. RTd22]|uniref:hypothetical protein n=1 Tax=Streptomyces sp. RTd22 TaxID=1841249 RepID=UPI000B120C6E|nr:hypothetical protein [Streptomyces sp. RTd22]